MEGRTDRASFFIGYYSSYMNPERPLFGWLLPILAILPT